MQQPTFHFVLTAALTSLVGCSTLPAPQVATNDPLSSTCIITHTHSEFAKSSDTFTSSAHPGNSVVVKEEKQIDATESKPCPDPTAPTPSSFDTQPKSPL